MDTCKACNGSGEEVFDHDEDGRAVLALRDCRPCDGTGKVLCEACAGEGCIACNGTGFKEQ